MFDKIWLTMVLGVNGMERIRNIQRRREEARAVGRPRRRWSEPVKDLDKRMSLTFQGSGGELCIRLSGKDLALLKQGEVVDSSWNG